MREFLTEDVVRDKAGKILGFENSKDVKSGVGQLTTFNQLGFKGNNKKPDGWYLPKDLSQPAIILETKNSDENVESKQWQSEILENCKIAQKKYNNVFGILYNGYEIIGFKNCEKIEIVDELQSKDYYLDFFKNDKIDKEKIYILTQRINNCLHFQFGIKDLYHRMIFTACALVAKRYGATLTQGMDYATFHTSIHSTLAKSLQEDKKLNSKLDLLLEVYAEIKMNSSTSSSSIQEAINNFIGWVEEISNCINSNNWNGEDVMGIFFNEFNRYKKKSESGQVFTPDHITSFMYRLIEVDKDDVILDAACGSGAFLVKSMCNMIKEAGGMNTKKATDIKKKQLYGIEFDRQIFALACANMLIHKDGKTNLEQMDSRYAEASEWMKSKPITKVLMNPPFENKYGCLDIVKNVLDSVKKGTICAFILPDKKFEKNEGKTKRILKNNKILKIIKLPEKTFSGVTTSIFVIKAGYPQGTDEIFACYIAEDGLITVKNQGRHDIKNKWNDIENYWIDVIKKQSGDSSIQWIDPQKCWSYQMPQKPFEIYEEDFNKTVFDYLMFNNNVDTASLKEEIVNKVFYSSVIDSSEENFEIKIKKERDSDD